MLDEIRIAETARSADWIKTEYNNQSATSTFYTTYSEDSLESAVSGGYSTVGWNDTGWSHRRVITIDDTKVTGASGHSNFPMLFRRTDPDLRSIEYGGKVASSTAGDLLFTDWEGNTIDYEIESYTANTGELIAWVEVPFVSSTSTRDILMYFGNPGASYQPTNEAVWDSDYRGVFHLPNGATLGVRDSTANNNDGTDNSASATNGKIDGAASLNNSTSNIDTGLTNFATGAAAKSFSMWVYKTNTEVDVPFGYGAGSTKQMFGTYIDNVSVYFWGYGGVGNGDYDSNLDITLNNWNHIAMTYDGTDVRTYVNGQAGSVTTVALNTGSTCSTMGENCSNGANRFGGSLDELRVTDSTLSADWIATEYQNQSDPDTFYSFGVESVATRTASPATPQAAVAVRTSTGSGFSWYNSSWTNSKQITIDPNKVSGTTGHTNFPMLFSVTDADLADTSNGGRVASAAGDDILFVDWEGKKIDHEIEKYTNTTGELIAWVEVPFVSSTSSRDVYIYYGNGSASYQPTNEATWDSNYTWVLHLTDTTDSTSNGRNLSNLAGSPTTDSSGKIVGAYSYDGNDAHYNGTDYLSYFSTSVATIEAWVKQTGTPPTASPSLWNGDPIISNLDANIGLGSWNSSGNKFGALNWDGNADYVHTASTNDVWTHLILVHTGGNLYFYKDGDSVGSIASGDTVHDSPTSYLLIGGNVFGGGQYFIGSIDEIRVSNIARGADWIKTEYNNQSSPSTFYSYGAAQAETRQDKSGNEVPAIKVRGGVKFRADLWLRKYLNLFDF
ncbi:MAG: hypothetical protein COT91_00195 [Candidatus Doudnabacteria bacterium CG10_big_fil_rev_8_21_14_0_10_41_10]|uniref:LamG-like jellyroll fold domain-containing protein n=1 Tax=Candidatus Doudnabacteria bacterium CG10_big_fil_rev_8_21_14_0_10_41_10 TaxID=1974551 RepID=A0A2H0VF12_9BACT|nr:MAG: hypothetical protein COT91_00195 [Candidatus Doudnabacteria bacterium CG10_big_fil_rev_8_21_14_0_10_41_10]